MCASEEKTAVVVVAASYCSVSKNPVRFKTPGKANYWYSSQFSPLKAAFQLTISMREKRATGKIQRNNYHQGC